MYCFVWVLDVINILFCMITGCTLSHVVLFVCALVLVVIIVLFCVGS